MGSASGAGETILVVDDMPRNVKLLQDILEAKGYRVHTAANGGEALAALQSSNPDLVLLDVVMPDMNGFDVCREIKHRTTENLLPVVLVTALDSSEDRIRGIESGADDFLSKPVNMHELLARTRSLLRIRSLFSTVQSQRQELARWGSELEQKVSAQVDELERLGRLRRFLSPQVADLVVSSGNESFLDSHRSLIATLFCDLRGFTGFCADAEPEEAMQILRQYHESMGRLIHDNDGTIEHRAGDGIMVIFNDPLACANPAEKAVSLALQMRNEMKHLCERWANLEFDLGFGIGITVGYATLGMVGFEGRFDYTANGTLVNLAARLCDEADNNQILVTKRVLSSLDQKVNAQPLPARSLKGISGEVIPYNIES